MSCEVAALPFQVHANYGTWSIDFDSTKALCDLWKRSNTKMKWHVSISILDYIWRTLMLVLLFKFNFLPRYECLLEYEFKLKHSSLLLRFYHYLLLYFSKEAWNFRFCSKIISKFYTEIHKSKLGFPKSIFRYMYLHLNCMIYVP